MSLSAPVRPFPVAAFNALAARLPPWPALEAGRLMKTARRKAGLADFGDTGFAEALQRLTQELDSQAALHPMGRIMARQMLVKDLVRRLQVTAWRKDHPAVAQEAIREPLFILGLPRTGTTLLFNLLAQDPANRTPLAWELDAPCPPPQTATYQTDPRIRAAQKPFDQLFRLCPELFAIHEMGACLPQECVAITGMDAMSVQFFTLFNIPAYQHWIDQQSWIRPYTFHRQFLQHLQSGHAGARWVLKSPGNLATLSDILTVYPDARILQTHRDPSEVMPSLASLTWAFRRLYSDAVDPLEIGRQVTALWHEHLNRAMAARDARIGEPQRFFDLRYHDFVADPMGTIRTIYGHFGWEFSGIAHQRMKSYLRANPQGKYGKHRYALADFGMEKARLDALFAPYRQRFRM